MTTTQNNDEYRAAAEALDALDATREHPRTDLGARMKREREAEAAKNAAHTPGPWKPEPHCGNAGSAVYIQQPDASSNGGWLVATCWGPDKEANARLIAAAPELLVALETAVSQFDFTVSALAKGQTVSLSSLQNCAAAARAAIARATSQV